METRHKIVGLDRACKEIGNWKENGLKIVFTNGCFDILHPGHIDYLEKARDLGGKLVVGLNTDKSVRKIKGFGRPIMKLEDRGRMLASLAFVDMVVPFEEETPIKLIKSIAPDILVKGKDYEIENIVGADFVMANGGEVKTIDLLKGYSTSEIIEKIKRI